MKEILPGIFEKEKGRRRLLYTKKLGPESQMREFDPTRSKLAAGILKGIRTTGLKDGTIVLYLGAASGTTVSHFSDIIGQKGFIFAVEFSPQVTIDLLFLSEERKNIAPILADANQPARYRGRITWADMLYQDIAQKNQVEIFRKNLAFLKPGRIAILCIKARSIDISKKPKAIFNEVREELKKFINILEYQTLEPFEKDHCMFVCKK